MTLLLSFLITLLAVLGLSLGVLMGRQPIRGSCGGIGDQCSTCSRGCQKQHAENEYGQSSD